MNAIEPSAPPGERLRLDSADLESLARTISGRIRVQCAKCQSMISLRVERRELRIKSSPDLSQIDPTQTSRPRLVFWCPHCMRIMGYVEGDEWADTRTEADASDATRWNHLELSEEE